MGVIKIIKNFWLDFFAAYYQRLMRNSKHETPLSIVLHTTFIQSVNLVTILTFIMHLCFVNYKLNYYFFILPFALIAVINLYVFYYRLDSIKREGLLNRKAKFHVSVYSLYSLISMGLLVVALYIASKG